MAQSINVVYLLGPTTRDQVSESLSASGMNVRTAAGVAEALEQVANVRPALVVAELAVGEESGLELVKALRSDPRTASVAAIILSDRPEVAHKLAAFEAGADDFLVKPFDPAELAARARMLTRRFRKLQALGPATESLDHKKVTYLQKWALDAARSFEPVRNVSSSYGYSYDDARQHFECPPGAEIEHLEDLATRMCLERTFFDRIHLCPQCQHYAINFREICPSCSSSDITRVEMIHHFKCGHVAPSREFLSGLDYICPKCHTQLRHIGTDYDKPAEAYYCNASRDTFTDPKTDCVCLYCGLNFRVEMLLSRDIYAYTISDRGLLAAQTGQLYEAGLDAVLLDYDLEIYNSSYFHRQLGLEVERARRYQHPFGVALIRLDQYDQFLERYGEASRRYLAQVAGLIKANTRSSDVPGKHEKDSIAMIFPETDLEGTRLACEKLRQEVLKLQSPRADVQLTVSCAVSAFPTLAENQHELLKGVAAAFAKTRAQGGNMVVIAEKATT